MSKFVKKASLLAFAGVLALSVAAAPGAASAQLTQSQIDSILSLLDSFGVDAATRSNVEAALTGQPTTPTAPTTGIPAGFTFTTNLTVGSSSNDVMYLQILLNSDSATQVAASGAGSSGNETTYFGPLTQAAVVKFQDKYASEVLTPVGLSAGTGFFGPSSRTKANALLGGVPGTPGVPSTPGQVNVTASGPAASTLVAGQAVAPMVNLVLSGSGTVTNVTLKRLGVSANTTPSNVYLFDGAQRLTDPASINSDGVATFNNPSGLFTVSGSRTVTVRSDIATGTSGETVGFQVTGVTLSSGTVGGLPVSGNLHTIASATLAAVDFGTITPTASTVDPANDVVVWNSIATVSTRNVNLERIALRNIGSINSADIQNFRLQINGVQVAQVQNLDANGYVTFNLTGNPHVLQTGSRTFRVVADIIGGSGRNVQMSLRRAADAGLVDSSFNVNLTATSTDGFAASTGVMTIASGTMTVIKASDSPSGNVTVAATDAVLARYTFTAFGEQIKVETLTVDFTYTDNGGGNGGGATLRNGRIMVNGNQVGSTATLSPSGDGTQYTTNFVVNPGSPATVEVRADIFDNDGTDDIDATDTILVNLFGASTLNNAIPQVSLGTLDVPTANVNGNTLTAQTGTMTLVKRASYANQTITVPKTGFMLGAWDLSNGDIEDVNITTFSLDIDEVTNTTFSEADITDFYLKYGSNTTTVKGTASAADNDWSVNFTLAKNQSLSIELWGNVGSTITSGDSVKTDLTVTGTGLASSTSVSQSDIDGQTIAAGTGTIAASLNSQSPVSAIVDDNQTLATAVFNFTSSNDSYTITDVTVTVGNATALENIILKNGLTGATMATKPGAASVTFSGLTLNVPANDTNAIIVELDLGSVGAQAGTTGASIQTTLNTATAKDSQGVSSTVSSVPVNGKAIYQYKAIPTITSTAYNRTLTPSAEVILSEFTVSTTGGTVEWKKMIFDVSKTASAGIIVTNGDLALYDVTGGSRQTVTGTFTTNTLGNTDTSGTIEFVATDAEQLSGAKNYELVETNGSAVTANGSISTRITEAADHAASNDYATVAATTTNFVWSDVSASLHGETTSDWTNDDVVKSLPTPTQVYSINTF